MAGEGSWVWTYLRVATPLWVAATVSLALLAAIGHIRREEAAFASFGLAVMIGVIWFFVDTMLPLLRDQSTPEELLDRRLAAGEIDEEEYRRLLGLIRRRASGEV